MTFINILLTATASYLMIFSSFVSAVNFPHGTRSFSTDELISHPDLIQNHQFYEDGFDREVTFEIAFSGSWEGVYDYYGIPKNLSNAALHPFQDEIIKHTEALNLLKFMQAVESEIISVAEAAGQPLSQHLIASNHSYIRYLENAAKLQGHMVKDAAELYQTHESD